jgi:hypothetical protein
VLNGVNGDHSGNEAHTSGSNSRAPENVQDDLHYEPVYVEELMTTAAATPANLQAMGFEKPDSR